MRLNYNLHVLKRLLLGSCSGPCGDEFSRDD